jgi:hypothetical protein
LSYRSLAAAAVAVLALQACAPKSLPTVTVADDLNEGLAKSCSYSPVQPKPGASVEATITMTNDGWCAYRASEQPGEAYLLGLVTQRPENGELQIRQWAGQSRVEYYPRTGFVGTDKFAVALRPQTGGPDATVQLTAVVSRGAGMPAPLPPVPERERAKPRPRSRARHPVHHPVVHHPVKKKPAQP